MMIQKSKCIMSRSPLTPFMTVRSLLNAAVLYFQFTVRLRTPASNAMPDRSLKPPKDPDPASQSSCPTG